MVYMEDEKPDFSEEELVLAMQRVGVAPKYGAVPLSPSEQMAFEASFRYREHYNQLLSRLQKLERRVDDLEEKSTK